MIQECQALTYRNYLKSELIITLGRKMHLPKTACQFLLTDMALDAIEEYQFNRFICYLRVDAQKTQGVLSTYRLNYILANMFALRGQIKRIVLMSFVEKGLISRITQQQWKVN